MVSAHDTETAAPAEGGSVPASRLLRRIEEQAGLIARARLRVQKLTEALETERAARGELTEELARERSRSRRLSAKLREVDGEAASDGGHVRAVERADALERQLGQAWERIADLSVQLAWASRPLWRKLLRRRPAPH
jgi:hypothetical protein